MKKLKVFLSRHLIVCTGAQKGLYHRPILISAGKSFKVAYILLYMSKQNIKRKENMNQNVLKYC